MKKYTLFIIAFAITMFHSQISMEYKIISHTDSYKLKINITNVSDSYYLLPLDQNGFKAYYESEYCGNFNDQNYPYRFFAPTVMLSEQNTGDYLFPGSSRGHVPEGDGAEQYIQNLNKIASMDLNKIADWKRKYYFKDDKDAFKNFYITKNLLVLKPHEKYYYEISLDLANISRSSTSSLYDYYSLKFANYDLSLNLCITDDAYSWLTNKQKIKLKKYKFYKGIIKSNSIKFKAYE